MRWHPLRCARRLQRHNEHLAVPGSAGARHLLDPVRARVPGGIGCSDDDGVAIHEIGHLVQRSQLLQRVQLFRASCGHEFLSGRLAQPSRQRLPLALGLLSESLSLRLVYRDLNPGHRAPQ
ncbi:MAG TPA: hypothetical protein VGA22_14170 [Gemmatimonadales bacterium]